MTESLPPTLRKYQQLHRGLTEKVLDKAASDPAWKQQLLDDPQAAVRRANFPETQQLEQWRQGAGSFQGEEVRGQQVRLPDERYPIGCSIHCGSLTLWWHVSW